METQLQSPVQYPFVSDDLDSITQNLGELNLKTNPYHQDISKSDEDLKIYNTGLIEEKVAASLKVLYDPSNIGHAYRYMMSVREYSLDVYLKYINSIVLGETETSKLEVTKVLFRTWFDLCTAQDALKDILQDQEISNIKITERLTIEDVLNILLEQTKGIHEELIGTIKGNFASFSKFENEDFMDFYIRVTME